MASEWGRKETIVWPPNLPVYTYGALLMGCVLMSLFMWCRFTLGSSPLQAYYMPAYIRSAIGAAFDKHDKFRLLYVGDGVKVGRIAAEADVAEGSTPTLEGKDIPLALSQVAATHGYRSLYRGPELSYLDAPLHTWFRSTVFERNGLFQFYDEPIYLGLVFLVGMLVWSVRKDIARRKRLKYGRRLKGPVLLTPKEFNKSVNGDGIGFQTLETEARLRIPESSEAQHVQIIGDTGSGKTTLIMQMLQQIEDRKESAIIYDPACEFVQRFYDEKRGDIILNPLDERCPYWGPAEELRRKAEAKAIAASLYQPTSDKKGEFFTETPQKIFAHLLTFGPTPQQLVEWMSNPDEIDKRVQGTENASILAKGAQQQRGGVLGSLGLIADSLRMLPTREEKGDKVWTATDWAEKREGWIFITSKAAEREALRPLHSLWIDLLVLRLLNAPRPGQKKVWFVLDELASLQRLPQLHTAITENRKSKNPLILGFQGKAQLEVIYGHMAEVMLSQPATKIFLKTTEPKAAEWVSKAIGQVEIERMKETHHSGAKAGKNFTLDRQTEPLVMDSEISGLADKHAFLKLGNDVVRFSFAYTDIAPKAPDFEPRKFKDDELSFDPYTLTPKIKPGNPVAVGVPVAQLPEHPKDPEDEPGFDEEVEEDSLTEPAPPSETERPADEKTPANTEAPAAEPSASSAPRQPPGKVLVFPSSATKVAIEPQTGEPQVVTSISPDEEPAPALPVIVQAPTRVSLTEL